MECSNPYWLEVEDEHIPARCGRCVFCLIKKRKDWSYRCWIEHRHSIGSMFVTLTYDEQNVPDYKCLVKSDLQKYMKRLRKRVDSKIRYYAVGEYGTLHGRPHYHVLLFNVMHYDEVHVRESWSKGQVHVGKVNAASIMYVLKYVVQPEQSTNKLQKPFVLMSRAYGIGGAYLSDDVVDWHRRTKTTYCRMHDQKVGMPKFFRDKIFYKEYDKAVTREKIKKQIEADKVRNDCELIRAGIDVEKARKESRDFVVRQLKSKVQFTEKL